MKIKGKPSTPRSRFLELPVEVRQIILTYVLLPLDRYIYLSPKQSWVELDRAKTLACSPVLLVCRKVHAEAVQLMYLRATIVLYAQPGFLVLPSRLPHRKLVRRLDIGIPMAEQQSGLSSARLKAKIYLPAAPDRLLSQLQSVFPQARDISLTLCAIPPRAVPYMSSLSGATVCDLRALLLHSLLSHKITRLRYQLTDKLSYELFDLGQHGSQEVLKERVGRAGELPNLKQVEFYFTTPLSKPTHNRPIMWAARTAPVSSTTILHRSLRQERGRMRSLGEVLPGVFPQVESLRLCRMLYWRGNISYELIDMREPEDLVVPKLLRRRTIGADSAEHGHARFRA
ncbi:hypothetical protein A1O3_02290 [Capronia epimyces CBS 606.96]|uniref:F-box domain-containing protein n=1 Tax=Capronia epimyces CBS 606.96 TaxID=1182542 RepID=W9Z3Y5_9EURO|nr:uncharacterized protein A1O3_02290 [Capronia epimyces CBS 606.96]EXJ89224.1 hypothetical protein A1O3_02290 [Capronia epimyces CBS 606.96]